MASELNFDEFEVELATGKIVYLAAGQGATVVYLHHSWGSPGALAFHQALVDAGYRVIVPSMPGWGGSDRPSWARSVRDVAILVGRFLDGLAVESVNLIGAGFGGYVATELATMSPTRLDNLVLLGPAGVLPEEGEILDQMMLSHRKYIEESFKDRETYIEHMGEEPAPELRELWDLSREMTARVSWKPYLHNRRLSPLLADIHLPTLLIWGDNDKVVPVSVSDQFQKPMSNAQLHVVEHAGHLVEFEQPQQVADQIASFLKQAAA